MNRTKFQVQLQTLGFPSYQAYLESEHWRNVRKRFFTSRLYKGCCEVCLLGNRPIQIHHRSYKALGHEPLRHLVALCSSCHKAAHALEYQHDGKVGLWGAARRLRRKRVKR